MIHTGRRYLVVTISCALVHNTIMIGCDFVGVHYLPANGLSYVIVVLWGYGFHSWFTFDQPLSMQSLVRYAAGMATNFPGSVALMFVFCDVAGLSVPIAAPTATMVLFGWNFVTSRWAIMGRPSLQKAI